MKFIKTDLAKQLEQSCNSQEVPVGYTREPLDFTPKRGTSGSAGYDLRACIERQIIIFPGEVVKIPTGIKIWIGSDSIFADFNPDVTLIAEILPRSSTQGAILNNTVGIIDADYQGEIFVKLRNITPEAITIGTGEAFAQLIFKPVFIPTLVETVGFIEVTDRGEGGFGSTNK